MRALTVLTGLISLRVSKQDWGREDADAIGALTQLTHLVFHNIPPWPPRIRQRTAEECEPLMRLERLERAELHGLPAEALRTAAHRLRRLRELELHDGDYEAEDLLELSQLQNLSALVLVGQTTAPTVAVDALRRLPAMDRVVVREE